MTNHPNRSARNAADKYATILVQAYGRRYDADGWSRREEPLYRCWVDDRLSYADRLLAAERHARYISCDGAARHGNEVVSRVVVIGQRQHG